MTQSQSTSPYTIQPIETAYKGYRMRSRLEARWAVFFDDLGFEWQYEPEGYDLGEPGWYLPDFRITGGIGSKPAFLEIKPQGLPISELRTADQQVRALFHGLQYTHLVALVVGEPYEDKYRLSIYDPDFPDVKWFGAFAQCRKCSGLWLVSCNGDIGMSLSCEPGCDSDKVSAAGDRLSAAYDAARAFRGEE